MEKKEKRERERLKEELWRVTYNERKKKDGREVYRKKENRGEGEIQEEEKESGRKRK